MAITMYDIISKKRDGYSLNEQEIDFFVKGIVEKTIPDYQTSALLMAIYLRGMSEAETVILTKKIAESGTMVDLSALGDTTVDKHSTGGVGDKTTLIAAPIAAAVGCTVAKMSGRGLGHTGGTVDKLESIKGFKTNLSGNEFLRLAEINHLVVAGQSGNLTPADKILYSLRDVTATVSSIPLIASSIMSKKLAGGSKNIVLDVKVGSGAFMKSVEQAERLAEQMIAIGKASERRVTAVLSSMDIPLGRMIGNSLEVIESARLLKNPENCDLLEVSVTLATEMIVLSLGFSPTEARKKAEQALYSGQAFNKLCDMVALQGGDKTVLKDASLFEKAGFENEIISPNDGYISSTDAEKIGLCAVRLGAGRVTKDDKIDYSSGIIMLKKTGDRVGKGEVIAKLLSNNKSALSDAQNIYLSAFEFSDERPEIKSTILKIIR